MDARVEKLKRYYGISAEDAVALVNAELDAPRKVKADKEKVDKLHLNKETKDKIKGR